MNKTNIENRMEVGGVGKQIRREKKDLSEKRNEEKRKDRVAEETANSKLTNCKQQTTDN